MFFLWVFPKFIQFVNFVDVELKSVDSNSWKTRIYDWLMFLWKIVSFPFKLMWTVMWTVIVNPICCIWNTVWNIAKDIWKKPKKPRGLLGLSPDTPKYFSLPHKLALWTQTHDVSHLQQVLADCKSILVDHDQYPVLFIPCKYFDPRGFAHEPTFGTWCHDGQEHKLFDLIQRVQDLTASLVSKP
jgi:hypothetical protein